jgi:hypothetical protein
VIALSLLTGGKRKNHNKPFLVLRHLSEYHEQPA